MTDTATNLRVIDTFMVTCDDCGGEGGLGDLSQGERWDECPTCHGSGWISNDEPDPGIDQDELPPPTDGGGAP